MAQLRRWIDAPDRERRYAAVECLSVCLSVRPSITSRYCIETIAGRTELVLAWRLPSTYPTYLFLTAMGILPISNHSSFRVPFDKTASVYFI